MFTGTDEIPDHRNYVQTTFGTQLNNKNVISLISSFV